MSINNNSVISNLSLLSSKSLLVACDSLVLSGGLLRFERVGTILRNWGHELAFVCLSEKKPNILNIVAPVITLDMAITMKWDAVMIPGAGFPESTIKLFSNLHADNFGVRVQHVLNDQCRKSAFMAVNKAFQPHIVIFNNQHWPVGSFTDFKADRFHVLIGGIDTSVFNPAPYKSHPLTKKRWIVGGQARKNPEPLIEALKYLPSYVTLRLFGKDIYLLSERYKSLLDDGRLELVGPLHGDQALTDYYQTVDCVVMTETFAGWANLVAEAMACGVPVVCTPHGTLDIAFNEKTALIIDQPTPEEISHNLIRLINDSVLCERLAKQARKIMTKFSWDHYVQRLLKIIQHDGAQHYTYAPEDGLYGKWPVAERLHGLEPLLERSAGCSVIDLGAAEGIIAREFLKYGAKKVRGFELDLARVNKANALCSGWDDCEFRVADLSNWDEFCDVHKDCIEKYDIVLYLGIHHHLPQDKRQAVLANASNLAISYFAIRTPYSLYEIDGIDGILERNGFSRFSDEDAQTASSGNLGIVRLYERT